jgi:hypothetical protein
MDFKVEKIAFVEVSIFFVFFLFACFTSATCLALQMCERPDLPARYPNFVLRISC